TNFSVLSFGFFAPTSLPHGLLVTGSSSMTDERLQERLEIAMIIIERVCGLQKFYT
ncbi:14512_t:CDS:2, partial [Dentiscutata erythropus]